MLMKKQPRDKMNYYEHTYIASQSLNNKDLSDLHQKIEDLIKKK